MTTASIILKLSNIPILVTTAYALTSYKGFSKELKIFSWFLLFSLFVQLISSYLGFKGINNIPFVYINMYGSVGFLGWFYSEVFAGFINRRIFLIGVAVFCVFSTVELIVNGSFREFNSFLLTAQCILIVIVSMFTYSFMLNANIRELKGYLFHPLLWINSGLFIYYTSNMLLFYFENTIKAMKGFLLVSQMWIFHAFFITVMYSCFFIGIWKRQRN